MSNHSYASRGTGPTTRTLNKVKRTFDQIRALLSVEQEQLFTTFLEFDVDLSARLDQHEFRKMLQYFHPSINARQVDEYLSDISESDGEEITFIELLEWWEMQKADLKGVPNDVWFTTSLKVQFATQKAKDYWSSWTGQTPLDERLSHMTEGQCQHTIGQYRDCLYLLRLWMHDVRTRAEEQLESRLMKQAESVDWSQDELDDLHEMFMRVSRGKDSIGLESGLPRLCSLLNYDLTFSCLERSHKLYDARMTFKSFLVFWACRPESGKMTTSKQPVWRWGEKAPQGSELSRSMFY